MIPVEIYTQVYYLVLSIIIILGILPLFFKPDLESFPKINLLVGTILILSITILFIGLRDPYGGFKYFGDTKQYTRIFNSINHSSIIEKGDLGFYFLMLFSKQFLEIKGFYFICALLYVVPVYLSFKKWFKEYAYFALILFVTSMSFWAFGINGVRNGLATSLFIFALSFYEKKRIIAYLIMFLSFFFHNTMILPILAIILATNFTNTRLLIKIWFVAVIISYFFGSYIESYLGEFLHLLGGNQDRINAYLADEIDGEVVAKGFRLDFVVYSSIAIFTGFYYIYKLGFKSKFYSIILNTYIISNTIWVLLIYLAYTNRMAYLSWFLIPIVLIYPILKNNNLVKNQPKWFYFMILGSLFFTLIMEFK